MGEERSGEGREVRMGEERSGEGRETQNKGGKKSIMREASYGVSIITQTKVLPRTEMT